MLKNYSDGIKALRDASGLKSKTVLVRCDFNVPVKEDGSVIDDLRIRKTLPTIAYLRDAGAKIVLVSHIEGKAAKLSGGVDSLEPVANHINSKYAAEFGGSLHFIKDFLAPATADFVMGMNDGEVVLFENLRADAGEKSNSTEFAEKLGALADVYVNDAFAVSHRAHASVVALPSLPKFADAKYAGIQLMQEITRLEVAFQPPHPFVFILGGAKFETKLPLIEKFMTGERAADYVFIGGALLNDVLKAKGLPVGKSLVAKNPIDLSAIVSNPKLVVPTDVVVKNADTGEVSIKKVEDVSPEDIIADVGPSLAEMLMERLSGAQFILWNGPMGNYEEGFKDQTIAMAKIVATSGIDAALGGGDTTAAVAELGLEEEKAASLFVSTGGGAMLEYLQNESLPGAEALK